MARCTFAKLAATLGSASAKRPFSPANAPHTLGRLQRFFDGFIVRVRKVNAVKGLIDQLVAAAAIIDH